MKHTPESLYLDLMKKALSFTLWPEPARVIEPLPVHPPFKRKLIATATRLLDNRNLLLARKNTVNESERRDGKGLWPGLAHTMIGLKRLDNIQGCVETVLSRGIEGDLIETGVWRGGACIFMRSILAAYGIEDRKVFVADSFEGLPKPSAEKYPADANDLHFTFPQLAISQDEVQDNFRKYNLLDDQVYFLKGWFKDTLPDAPIEKLAVMRLDGDMYESTMDALVHLYPKLSRGGFCIIDDYALQGCKEAVDDFRKERQVNSEIKYIDWSGCYWEKNE